MTETRPHRFQQPLLTILGLIVAVAVAIILVAIYFEHQSKLTSKAHDQAPHTTWIEADLAKTVSIDDSTSYVPLNLQGSLEEKAWSALQVLKAFKDKHTDLEVTSSQIISYHYTDGQSYVEGLWINHRRRCPCENQQ